MNQLIKRHLTIWFLLLHMHLLAQENPKPLFVGYPDRIKTLDSLIDKSASFALRKSDYTVALRKAHLSTQVQSNIQVPVQSNDQVQVQDSLFKNVATRFFSHLAYGNKIPKLQYDGVRFKLNTYDIKGLLNEYLRNKSLIELVNYFNSSSTEVNTLINTLQLYRDSSKKYPEKIALLEKATNEYRWLNAIRQGNRIILVNIPSAQLKAFEGNKIVLSMRVVVGKLATPTNTLASTVEKIIVNPYWTVPKSISSKEMLPKILESIDYLKQNNLQVLNENGKVVAPETIDWQAYSEENFPFTIRQATGSDNSLGILKVDFDSPFGIYLHDSPEKALFSNTNRFYSHGCMRMEKPVEMGKWLTQNNKQALDTFDFKKVSKNIPPKYINVTLPTHVIVWYSLIDFDNKGKVKFYKDWYEQKAEEKSKMNFN
ncbi:MAG: hypothetical protein RL377_1526 [Bacteroidota bacterium]